jgi:hypothetical protein
MGASPQVVDWDDDGDLDIISGEYNGKVVFFRNTGSTPTVPNLTNAGYIQANGVDIDVGNLSVPEIDDWNEDGLNDLIVGCDYGSVYVYINIGTSTTPVFGSSQKIEANGSPVHYLKNCARIADLNEDGLKDLIVTGLEGACYFWPNYGTNAAPVFYERYELTGYTDLVDPEPGSYNWCHFEVNDWNEDGHIDLLYARWESEVYVHLHGSHKIQALADPINPPIVIPSQGGAFQYTVSLSNTSAHDIVLDAWTEGVQPDGQLHGPMLEKRNLTIAAGATIRVTRPQVVPAFVPPGVYTLNLCLGKMGNGCFAMDGFDLTKN